MTLSHHSKLLTLSLILLVFPKNVNALRSTPAMVAKGKVLFAKMGCNACHSADGSKRVGPTMKGIFGQKVTLKSGKVMVRDLSYIQTQLWTPKAVIVKGYPPLMPTYKKQIDQEGVRAIAAYIQSLNPKLGPRTNTPQPKAQRVAVRLRPKTTAESKGKAAAEAKKKPSAEPSRKAAERAAKKPSAEPSRKAAAEAKKKSGLRTPQVGVPAPRASAKRAVPPAVAQPKAKRSMSPARRKQLALGRHYYLNHCSFCHGVSGAGDGPGGRGLPKHIEMKNFAKGQYLYGKNPNIIFQLITNGSRRTAVMPAWKHLPKRVRWALVYYLLSLEK